MTIDISLLRKFSSLKRLDESSLLVLANTLVLETFEEGYCLFETGGIDMDEIFLCRGSIELVAEDGRKSEVSADMPAASHPIARLRPRQYTARCKTSCECFLMDSDMLESLVDEATGLNDSQGFDVGYGVEEISYDSRGGKELLKTLREDIKNKRFVLTSLPEVALKIREMIEGETSSADDIARLVNSDPAIAAKLIRAANSPVYHGAALCDSSVSAIVRLGLQTTKQLVLGFALKDLFVSSSPMMKKMMNETWEYSVNTAALSFVLSRHLKVFSTEEALLAGLLHDIGIIAILNYAEGYQDLTFSEDNLRKAVAAIKGEVGSLVLEAWGFNESLVCVARESCDWNRFTSTRIDYCDLVIVAKLYGYIGEKIKPSPPKMDAVPAFNKFIAEYNLEPEDVISLLDEAREQVNELRSIYNS